MNRPEPVEWPSELEGSDLVSYVSGRLAEARFSLGPRLERYRFSRRYRQVQREQSAKERTG
jgi:hypothetical protein